VTEELGERDRSVKQLKPS
jgi:hypothetical protein